MLKCNWQLQKQNIARMRMAFQMTFDMLQIALPKQFRQLKCHVATQMPLCDSNAIWNVISICTTFCFCICPMHFSISSSSQWWSGEGWWRGPTWNRNQNFRFPVPVWTYSEHRIQNFRFPVSGFGCPAPLRWESGFRFGPAQTDSPDHVS